MAGTKESIQNSFWLGLGFQAANPASKRCVRNAFGSEFVGYMAGVEVT